ncbi:hypothetical protein F443_17314 [Plasmopara halstedii]|uniref:Glycosyl transferase family 1 domain-containing protein n=1 Tax=Plasmopara halstedii TaxID=4781 RepID=A0A0P1B513_PLAHL|nr:hypothetical protein F443_17314 [Plasmopara halstedii]CEG48830.1 hypothetical protein F443_17314 [Plasmopara halstedii]|eukprot:XP_024585199.1 hypothetical protein F443_17314 [Plasmopara halstedii]
MCMTGVTKTVPPRRSRVFLLLVPLVVVGVYTLIVETMTLFGIPGDKLLGLHRAFGLTWRNRFRNDLLPEEVVAESDLLHLSLLHEVCIVDMEASFSWQYGSPGNQDTGGTANNSEVLLRRTDKNLLQKLRQCPTVDIFLPENAHSNNYCEDAAAYVKYLKSRLLPQWILEIKFFDAELKREVDYFDLCPKTPMLFFDHHWGVFDREWNGILASPRWPKDKPIYMVPNIEMVELTPNHYWDVDVVLCKIKECYDRVTKWYEQEGSPRNTKVLYTKHTSIDPTVFVRKRLGEYSMTDKDFSTVKFYHMAGNSTAKGTREVLDCWTYESDLPPLAVYIDRAVYYKLFQASYKLTIARSHSPVNIHLGMLDRLNYSKIVADASFVINPSYSEGYGHIINQARASGAVIITNDLPPMNEMITANESGVLISVTPVRHPWVVLGGNYAGRHGLKGVGGLVASFESSDVCEAVHRMMQLTTPEIRYAMGLNARRQYHSDTKFFADIMQEVLNFAAK